MNEESDSPNDSQELSLTFQNSVNSELLLSLDTPEEEVKEFAPTEDSVGQTQTEKAPSQDSVAKSGKTFHSPPKDSATSKEAAKIPNQDTVVPTDTTKKQERQIPKKMADIQTITLPNFTPNNVGLWLKLVKGKLKAYGVAEKDLYCYIRREMPVEIADRVPELIEPSDENDNFTYFSEKLKDVYGRTREQDIRELLNKMSLNDEGPKRMMDRMIEKAGSDLSALVIADLFRSKLPKDVARMMVSLEINNDPKNNEDLKKLAEAAEKFHRFEQDYLSPKVCAMQKRTSAAETKQTESDTDEVKRLKKKVDELEKSVKHLYSVVDGLLNKGKNSNTGNSGQNSRGRSQNRRSRSSSRSRIDYSKPENRGKCQYHVLYGDKAFHCTLPCVDSGKPLAQKPERTNRKTENTNASQ